MPPLGEKTFGYPAPNSEPPSRGSAPQAGLDASRDLQTPSWSSASATFQVALRVAHSDP